MSVKPHPAVICVTCGSRLKVLDRRLIGGIANCPKCGAMVQITPEALSSEQAGNRETTPEQSAPPASQHAPADTVRDRPRLAIGREAGIDSAALTQSSVASPHELDATTLDGPTDDGSQRNDDEPTRQGLQTGQGSLAPASLPVDPAQVWQSESSRRVSQFGLVVTLGLFGLIAATVAFVQFARSWSGSAEQASAVSVGQHQPSGTSGHGAVAGAIGPASDLQGQSPDGDDRLAQSPTRPDDSTGSEDGFDSHDSRSAAHGDDAQRIAADQADVAGPAARPLERSDSLQPHDQPQRAAGELPAEFMPESVFPTQPEAPQTPPGLDELPPGLDELPPGLRKFVPLLNRSIADNSTPQIFDMPPTIDSIQLDAAAGEEIDEDAAIKRPAIDIPRALAMRFAIDHAGVTLAELMLLVSQLTGAAVEVELISLDLAGISTTDTLKTAAGWMSVQQWLDQSLAPAGMVAEIVDERVLVHATPQSILQASGTALQLDDFGDSAADVARWIRPIVGPIAEMPVEDEEAAKEDPWTFVEDEKRLEVPLDRSVLIRTLLAVESARRIRGLPGRIPRWQTARWSGAWSSAAAARRDDPVNERTDALGNSTSSEDTITDWPLVVEGTTGPPLDSPRTAAGLLRQLGSENQVAIIVAWRDALRHQFYPADLAMPFSDNMPAGALIDELIGESALQARDAGSDVWWIGSEALYDRYEVISWLTIPAGSGERIARQFADALGVDDLSALPVAWDETTLLVRAPRYLARQLSRLIQP